MSRSILKKFQGQGGVELGRGIGELCLSQARNAQVLLPVDKGAFTGEVFGGFLVDRLGDPLEAVVAFLKMDVMGGAVQGAENGKGHNRPVHQDGDPFKS